MKTMMQQYKVMGVLCDVCCYNIHNTCVLHVYYHNSKPQHNQHVHYIYAASTSSALGTDCIKVILLLPFQTKAMRSMYSYTCINQTNNAQIIIICEA